jgi:hypothetical protein
MDLLKSTVVTLLIVFSADSLAYKILEPSIHETITRASKACFDHAKTQDAAPAECSKYIINNKKGFLDTKSNKDVDVTWMHDSSIALFDIKERFKRIKGYTATYPHLEEAVRWPDDPTQELGAGFVKFGAKLLIPDVCESYRNKITGNIDLNAGLICTSHYGDLQFMHAQASSLDEPAIDTYRNIINWAEFLYSVASGEMTNDDLDEEYCKYFDKDTAFNNAMLPNKTVKACGSSDNEKWTVATLFNLTCSSPVPSKYQCKEWVGAASFDKARITATGALLHLIQDSYSQSHVKRGDCEIRKDKNDKDYVIAKVECELPEYFTTYKGQHNHDDADQAPMFSKSCDDESAMNPVLAGAITLWYIDRRESFDEFRDKVLYKVFGSPEHIKNNGMDAELGHCFVEELNKKPREDTAFEYDS